MAKKAAKPVKHVHKTVKKTADPTESVIIQAGIVFIIVAAIVVTSYVVTMYGVLK